MRQQQILIVEDDETIAFGLKVFLLQKGFGIQHADRVSTAKAMLTASPHDLILLDWNLPDGNGYEFCSYVKQMSDIPVIFLTVRDDEHDIVQGLDMGADDYIVKPFQLSVVLSRIQAVLRRTGGTAPAAARLTCGALLLDPVKTQVFCGGTEVPVTAGEYRLLLLLLQNKNQTLTRRVLLEKLWDADGDFVNDNTLTVMIKRLREKLGPSSSIKTIRGIGYRLEPDDE
ncbi:response regulator transcription factor [Paenibacillus sp. FSL L8-0470]|uniref:response regulator transcription factor n=1 Tax=Paenibacillus sp. FSL L8-0470 TaxID=2954688 RepID=UPI0030FB42D5